MTSHSASAQRLSTRPMPGVPVQTARPRLINCCSHTIRVFLQHSNRRLNTWSDIEPSGNIARVAEVRTWLEDIIVEVGATSSFSVPINSCVFTDKITGLPEPAPGTYFIVSRIVAEMLPGRTDLIYPDSSVRTQDKNNPHVLGILGCRSFSKASQTRIDLNSQGSTS